MNTLGIKSNISGYISSNRAAQLSGYSRDYIGQLCRSSRVSCERVAGEWRVELDSVLAYKQRFTPVENTKTVTTTMTVGMDSTDLASDDEYIPSVLAAKLTGYSQDYIGQLARSGAVEAKKVGRKWFIDRSSLKDHKKHNDDLLAAVQAEATGLYKKQEVQTVPNINDGPSIHISTTKPSEATIPQRVAIKKNLIEPVKPLKKRVRRVLPEVIYTTDTGTLIPDTITNNAVRHVAMAGGMLDVNAPEVKTMPKIHNKSNSKTARVDIRQQRRQIMRRTQVAPATTADSVINSSKNHKSNKDAKEIIAKKSTSQDNVTRSEHSAVMGIVQRVLLTTVLVVTTVFTVLSITLPDTVQKNIIKVTEFAGIQLDNNKLLKNVTTHVTVVTERVGLKAKKTFYKK